MIHSLYIFTVTPVALNQLFIGLNDLDLQMKFQWTDGTAVSYTNWAVNEPNNWQNRPEDCVAMYQKVIFQCLMFLLFWNDD
jgi:hypothetical protein